MPRLLTLSIALFLLAASAYGQRLAPDRKLMASLGFWNIENMFDTIPAPSYNDDDDYTPKSKYSWNTERYTNKLTNLSRVIDQMALDVIGLCEVENEMVVRDIVLKLETDYNYIYRATEQSGGRDMALLYMGDKFVPQEVRTVDSHTSRKFLYVRGELFRERVDIVIVHLPSLLNPSAYRARAMNRLHKFTDSLHRADKDSRLIVMGDFNATPDDMVMRRAFASAFDTPSYDTPLFFPFKALLKEGAGTYSHGTNWLFYDNILVSGRLLGGSVCYDNAWIFIEPYMLHQDRTKRRGYPLRTFTDGKYTNGFSDHLPVFLVLQYR